MSITRAEARKAFEIALAEYIYDVSQGYRLCIPDSRRKLNEAIDALTGSGTPTSEAKPAEGTRRSNAP